MVCSALAAGVFIVWIFAAHIEIDSIVRCALVLLAYLLALTGIVSLLVRLRIQPVLAAAMTVVLGLAWLTWPVWLSRALPSSGGQFFVHLAAPVHPLFAINGVVRLRFDGWDRYRIAYQQLTSLNQDVLYSLPHSIGPAAITHAAICAVSLGLSRAVRRGQ